MGPRTPRKTSQTAVGKADHTSQALDYKREGKTIREIALLLGKSVGYTHSIIEAGIKAIPEASRAALVHEVHEGVLAVIAAHVSKRDETTSAMVILHAYQKLMALMGLEAPKHSEITGKDGAPLMGEPGAHDDVLRSLAALAAAAAVGSGDPKPNV